MINKNGFLLICFGLISLFQAISCKKDMERNIPMAQFVFPLFNYICTTDSVVLEVRVQDSRQLMFVMAGLTDQQAVAVVNTKVVYPKTNDTIIRFVFWPDKKNVRGELEAFVKVSNGYEESRVFLKLHYLPEISFESFLVTSNASNDGIRLDCWDYHGVLRNTHQIPANGLLDMQAFTENELVYFQFTQANRIMAVNPLDGSLIWTFSQSLLPYNRFICFHRGASLLWVSDKAGVIKGLHPATGEQLVTSTMMQDTAAYLMSESNGFLYAAQKNLSGKTFFSVYYKTTAQRFFTQEMESEIKGIFPLSDSKVLLLLYSENSNLLLAFDTEKMMFSTPILFTDLNIQSALLLDNQHLLAINAGHLIKINFKTPGLEQLAENGMYREITADPVNNIFFIWGHNFVEMADQYGNSTAFLEFPFEIAHCAVIRAAK